MAKKVSCCSPAKSNSRQPTSAVQKRAAFSKLARALAHPVRIQILEILKAQNSCVCGELVVKLPVAQATVSQHLKVLKEAGIIRGEISGPATCYCIDANVLAEFKSLVAKF